MILLHAHTVWPVDAESIFDGAVVVGREHIVACGSFNSIQRDYPQAQVVDLTDSLLLPGLINAHTHLELSHLKGRIPYQGDFVDWVRRLIDSRCQNGNSLEQIIKTGCSDSIAGGVTTVADISNQHQSWRYLADEPIRKICFAEVLDITADWPKSVFYLERCITDTSIQPLLRLGLSPHAPYSVTPELYTLTARKAARHRLPLTTHLAESPAELDFLLSGSGPWRSFLAQIGKCDGYFTCPQTTPVDYFLRLDLAKQPFLLAHVNYITDEELAGLARTAHSVAYCPRSHYFFQHQPHRFRDMIEAGINVCLGTDSLASNESLSILDEMRFLHEHHPDVAADTILKMATLNAAMALQWEDQIGSITAGKLADMIAVPLVDKEGVSVLDILQSDRSPRYVMIHGQVAHTN